MLNENNSTIDETREAVIEEKGIGVSFNSGNNQDDSKSRVLRFLKNRGKVERPKKIWPLKDITFTGYKGEILGIIGANGAGKTTLSKIIAGLLKQDKGEITVDGKVTALFSFG